jgi:hypothetical protein
MTEVTRDRREMNRLKRDFRAGRCVVSATWSKHMRAQQTDTGL